LTVNTIVIFEILPLEIIEVHSETIGETMTGVGVQHYHQLGEGARRRRHLESRETFAIPLRERLSSFAGGEIRRMDLRLAALLHLTTPRAEDLLAMAMQSSVGVEETIGGLVPVDGGLHRRQATGRELLMPQVVRKRGGGGQTLTEIGNIGDERRESVKQRRGSVKQRESVK
jgi:hypothetical protein